MKRQLLPCNLSGKRGRESVIRASRPFLRSCLLVLGALTIGIGSIGNCKREAALAQQTQSNPNSTAPTPPPAKTFAERRLEVDRLFQMASQQQRQGQLQPALATLQQVLAAYRELDLELAVAMTQTALGKLYTDLKQYDQAALAYDEALALARKTKNLQNEHELLLQLGQLYQQQTQSDRALDYYKAAFQLSRRTRDLQLEAAAVNRIGMLYLSQDKLAKAEEELRRVVLLSRTSGDRLQEFQGLRHLALLYGKRQQPTTARGLNQQALGIARSLENRELQKALLLDIAFNANQEKNYELAREYFRLAQNQAEILGDRQTQGLTQEGIAETHRVRGEYTQALNTLRSLLLFTRRLGDRDWQARVLTQIAQVYLDLRLPEQALLPYEEALELFESTGNQKAQEGVRNQLRILAPELKKASD